ncbi:MAG: hypothetical protein JNM17_39160 [Archangium sp.]|nr:hypothetical protein [Archangium sp.]
MRVVFAVLVVSSFAFAQQKPVVLTPPDQLEKLAKKNAAPVVLKSPEELGFTSKKENKAFFWYSLPVNKKAEYFDAWQLVVDEKLLDTAVETVNSLVVLKRPMLVYFTECGTPNAFFSRDTGNITFCSELVALLSKTMNGLGLAPELAKERVRGALYFIFLHELGHALIHELQLPSTGREEDAVDQFATLMLLEGGAQGGEAAFSGALFFLALGEAKKGQAIAWWDEHSIEQQRFFNIACWLFGAHPFERLTLVAKGVLPPKRAERCGDEYASMRKAWKAIADTKLKRPLK